jgi:non-specific protein-tyrosine kinase
MKLTKALEKTKKSSPKRGSASPSRIQVIERRVKNNNWKPPTYSESTKVELDEAHLQKNRCVCITPDAPEIDSYKVLRTRIQHLTQAKGWNTLMVTSAEAGVGKTLTSVNLALTFSRAYNQTVLLVDCDFRHQSIHTVMGFENKYGLIDYLVDHRPLNEFMIWPGIDKLTVISGGRTFEDSTELLGSPRMKNLVQELKSRYDDRYIIFDVPPILGTADALALMPNIDSVIMVVEEGRSKAENIKSALEVIPPEKFLGFVMNRLKGEGSKYGYYYYR